MTMIFQFPSNRNPNEQTQLQFTYTLSTVEVALPTVSTCSLDAELIEIPNQSAPQISKIPGELPVLNLVEPSMHWQPSPTARAGIGI